MAIETSQQLDYIVSQSDEDIETKIEKGIDIIGALGELGVPMINTMSQFYQARNNVSGVTTMKRIKNELYIRGWGETEELYKDMDRNLYEKIGNVLWGGFENPEEE
jgi:hypothetical protein